MLGPSSLTSEIPDDGPSGKLLKLLDRHEWRPAHIHFIVSASHLSFFCLDALSNAPCSQCLLLL